MRKGRFLISFVLISIFLLNDLNCIQAQAISYDEGVIEQVEKYTSDFDAEEFNNCVENGEYQKAKELLEEAREGHQERWDYKGLTTNDMYIAYQFKEYMTDDFFSKGWWAKITSWFSGLFYNDELKEYITLQSPGKNKYKDMLKQLINDTKDDLIFWEYAQNINSSFQNIEGVSDCILDAKDKSDIDKKILELVDGNEKYSFTTDLSEAFTFLGAGVDYIDTTVSTIMDIQYICANKETLDRYVDLFDNIQSTKYRNGEYVAPKDLRDAAKELKEELEGDISKIIETAINEYAYTSAIMGIELAELIQDGFLGEFSLGLEIGSFIGNAKFDMSGLVQGVSYVQGYAYLGEIYTIILEDDKAIFLNNKSERNARKFRDDYNFLCTIRLKGEEAYLEMSDFSGTWLDVDRKLLQKWTDYSDKKDYCDNNLEMIKSFKFKEPKILSLKVLAHEYTELYEGAISNIYYYYDKKGRLICKNYEFYNMKEIYEYDENDHVISVRTIDFNNNLSEYDEYKYNAQGKEVEEMIYYVDDDIKIVTYTDYDRVGKVSQEICITDYGEYYHKVETKYKYDENNNCIQKIESCFIDDMDSQNIYEYKYDENNNCICETVEYSSTSIMRLYEYEYNFLVKEIEHTYYSIDEKDYESIGITNYVRDLDGKILVWTKSVESSNDILNGINKIIYEYNENGQLITECNEQTGSKVFYEYAPLSEVQFTMNSR